MFGCVSSLQFYKKVLPHFMPDRLHTWIQNGDENLQSALIAEEKRKDI